jgi:hypothetical protein
VSLGVLTNVADGVASPTEKTPLLSSPLTPQAVDAAVTQPMADHNNRALTLFAIFSASSLFLFPSLALDTPLSLRVLLAVCSVTANTLFQKKNFLRMRAERAEALNARAPFCSAELLLKIGLFPFSCVGNVSAMLMAWKAMHEYVHVYPIRIGLEAASLVGLGVESALSVRGTLSLKEEMLKWSYAVSAGLGGDKERAYSAWLPTLESDYNFWHALGLTKNPQHYAALEDQEIGVFEKQCRQYSTALPYGFSWYIAMQGFAIFLGLMTAIASAWNGVDVTQKGITEDLKAYISEDVVHFFEQAGGVVCLWVGNLLYFGFGAAYGTQGTAELSIRYLPAVLSCETKFKTKAVAAGTILLAAASVGPSAAIGQVGGAVRFLAIFGALSGPLTNVTETLYDAAEATVNRLRARAKSCYSWWCGSANESVTPSSPRSSASVDGKGANEDPAFPQA